MAIVEGTVLSRLAFPRRCRVAHKTRKTVALKEGLAMDLQGQTVLIVQRTGFGAGTSGSAPRLRQLDRLLQVAGASAVLLRWHCGEHQLLSLGARSPEHALAQESDGGAFRQASLIPATVRERLAITLAWRWTTRWHPFVRRHKEASQLIAQMQPRPSLVWAVSTGGVENLLLA